eukprot:6179817-Pleurochrysis_carterae.AAC.1
MKGALHASQPTGWLSLDLLLALILGRSTPARRFFVCAAGLSCMLGEASMLARLLVCMHSDIEDRPTQRDRERDDCIATHDCCILRFSQIGGVPAVLKLLLEEVRPRPRAFCYS